MREIFYITVVVANPSGEPGDHGMIHESHYFVEDNVVRLCDERGTPTGEKQRLEKGDDPKTVAKRLALRMYNATAPTSDFNRPLTGASYQWRVPY
jgi:hypothetical protein